MSRHENIIDEIRQKGLLPLYFHPSEKVSVGVLKALYGAGIRAVEYTNRGEAALANFKKMKAACDAEMPGMYLGIGTIKMAASAQAFMAAGADFIISPGIAEEIAGAVRGKNVLWIPGCMTPSEIMQAEALGAPLVKLFPGNVLGPQFVSAVKDVFPNMLFMPTGGVDTTTENLSAWFAAGVNAVGMGSKLLNKQMMEEENYAAIAHATAGAVAAIATIRQKHRIS